MGSRVRWFVGSLLAGFVVFCVVQDRVTAGGARRYVSLQRQAPAGHGPLVTIEDVMGPAVDRSVRQGLLSGGAVAAAGVTLGLVAGRKGWRR